MRLPPTTDSLFDDDARPYFLWWTDATVGQFKEHLASSDPEERAYWMGALLREANTRDVWLFVRPAEIRALWPLLIRYLGRSREMWAWLLKLPPPEWPPLQQIRASHAQDLWDRRVVQDSVLDFVRACQVRVPCHLGGGAALAGVYLGHRTTGDIDLFVARPVSCKK